MRTQHRHSRLQITTSLAAGLAGVMSLAAFVGCDSPPPLYPVRGQVLIDGAPATTGSIRFVPDSGRPASAKIDSTGKFKMISPTVGGDQEGLSAGRYRVAVTSNEIVDAETARWLAPAKYADHRTSGLEVNVEGPVQDLKIDLTWKGSEQEAVESVEADATASETGEGSNAAAGRDATAAVK